MAEFLRINLGSSFLLNAGILGLVNTLEYMQAKPGETAVDNCDYIIDGQTLMLSEDFLLSHNMGEIYVKSIVEHLREYCDLYQNHFKSLTQKHTEADEKSKKPIEKQINNKYSAFYKKLEKIKASENCEIARNIELLKEENNIESKYDIYQNIKNIINDKKNNSSLYYNSYFQDIMYEVLHYKLKSKKNKDVFLFYAMNFPLRKTSTPRKTYNEEFFIPLKNLLELNTNKKPKNEYCCIECRSFFYHNNQKEVRELSIMQDTVVDLKRKLSYYWNLKPDAYLCPICAFVYTFVPLGFAFLGQDAVFVNSNADIKMMRDLMSTYKTQTDEAIQDDRRASSARMYRPFTKIKTDMLENKLSNIQVIVKRRDNEHYGMNIIDNDIITKLKKSANYFEKLEPIEINDNLIVYDEVFNNILSRRNQYNLINKLLRYHLAKSGKIDYIKNILQIQIIFWGGSNVESMLKTANRAWSFGKEMRNSFSDVGEKDKDNKLRGLVYQLSNALTVGDREQFLNLVIRIYASKGAAIPYIFKNCFESDDMFKTIGYSYVLGLKASVYEKENDQEG